MGYKKDSIFDFGMYKGKTVGEVWKSDPQYIHWAINTIARFKVDLSELESAVQKQQGSRKNYCYKGYIDEFLSLNKVEWLEEMKNNFAEVYALELSQEQITAWEDCFVNLHRYLQGFRGKRYYLIFEYRLPYEGGRRPDVIILSEATVCILEFKMKNIIKQSDMDQAAAYGRDLREYHYESRNKKVVPMLVPTGMVNLSQEMEGAIRCAPNVLGITLKSILGSELEGEPEIWMNSKYEPLPTIVAAAKLFMNNEPLPNIKRVNSTGIPKAIEFLQGIASKAKENKEHIIALVTGVPGAGKTFLGLNFVYSKNEAADKVDSVYLSGNGPLIKVLTDALKSRVFVKDLHREMDEFFKRGNKAFNKNVVVFDEGQRIWDEERIAARYGLKAKTEADMMVEMLEENNQWSLLIILVGEGQEINKGENHGIAHWSKAIEGSQKPWQVLCPGKLDKYFSKEKLMLKEERELLNLTVSLRSHLAGEVSAFVNKVIAGEFKAAAALLKGIYEQGFTMFVTRSLQVAKEYCNERYGEETNKRYGLLASSKARNLKGYVDNSYEGTKEVNVGNWYNRQTGEPGSCCNLKEVVTEFACQGLELDMPIVCWGDDMKLANGSWIRYMNQEPENSPANSYRTNSYRVLLSRGRDGFIVFIPDNSRGLDEVYEMLVRGLGIKALNM